MTESIIHTLLIRLAGPLQSWGTTSRYTERDTGYEPSKSGVIGIIAAAMGYPRDAELGSLAALRMGVRVDQEGVPGYDFQSAGAGDDHPGIAMARDSLRSIERRKRDLAAGTLKESARGKPSISRRHFLQDAVFLVGLEGQRIEQLQEIEAALAAPKFPVGLGRRSYVPSVPIPLHMGGMREGMSLEQALRKEPWPVADVSWMSRRQQEAQCRFVIQPKQSGDGEAMRNDQPIGAAFATRVFGPRPVVIDQHIVRRKGKTDDHDI